MGFLEFQILPSLRGQKNQQDFFTWMGLMVFMNSHKIYTKLHVCLAFIISEESVTPTPSLRNPSSL